MIVIMGKTASGKTTVVNRLIRDFGMKQVVTYTTRPKRVGESTGKTYHFVTQEVFKKQIKEGFYAEWKSYDTVDGTWYYGTAKEDILNADDNTLIILTPSGYKDITAYLGYKPKSIYICSENRVIQNRLLKRGDDNREVARRIAQDNKDFEDVELLADEVIYNNDMISMDSLARITYHTIQKLKKGGEK